MSVGDAPAARPRVQRAGAPSWFVRFGSWVLGAGNAGWLLYLALVSVDVLRRSPVWDSALAVVPFHEPLYLGFGLGLSGLLILAGQLPLPTHVIAICGHAIGALTWGLLCGSWAYAAAGVDGLGSGNAILALQMTLLHAAFAYLRRH